VVLAGLAHLKSGRIGGLGQELDGTCRTQVQFTQKHSSEFLAIKAIPWPAAPPTIAKSDGIVLAVASIALEQRGCDLTTQLAEKLISKLIRACNKMRTLAEKCSGERLTAFCLRIVC